jgi:anaerobic magnesium-protoporphyrin IX monomethyl ester cyclase
MKILLSVPLPALIPGHTLLPDLGLGYLAAHLQAQGHEVALHDWNSQLSTEEFISYVAQLAPRLVGLKVFTLNIPAVLGTIELIRQACPETCIILGGPHISATEPEEIFVDFPHTSFAFQGEAENALPRLAAYLDGEPVRLDTIPGLIWQDNGLKINAPLWQDDLDNLGRPAWDLMDVRRYRVPAVTPGVGGPGAPLIVSRGCPGMCGFCCVHRISGKKARIRSPEHVLAEIEYLVKRFGVRQLNFMDTNFLYYRDQAAAVCEGLLQRGINLVWDCVSDFSWYNCDPALYRLMVRAGCRLIHVGIESGSDRIRRWLGQVESVAEVREQVKRIRQAGLQVKGYFLLGFPEETRAEMAQTIDLAFSPNFNDLHFNICFPLPGTKVYAWLKDHYQIPRLQWSAFHIQTSPYPMSELSSPELTRLWESVQNTIFWRPQTLTRWVTYKLRAGLKLLFTHGLGEGRKPGCS